MYILNCMENGNIIDSLATENIKEIEMFFNKNKYFANLKNNIETIQTMEKSEIFKFHKNKNRNKYIEVVHS